MDGSSVLAGESLAEVELSSRAAILLSCVHTPLVGLRLPRFSLRSAVMFRAIALFTILKRLGLNYQLQQVR